MECLLVEAVGLRLLGEAEYLERLGVAQVRLLERGGSFLLVGRKVVPADRAGRAGGLSSGLAIGPLLAVLDRMAALRSDFLDRPELVGGATGPDGLDRGIPAAELHLEGPALALDERGVLRGRHELVLGPADHRHKAAQDRTGVERQIVVEEAAHLRAQFEQEQLLADRVQDVAAIAEAQLSAVRGQEAVTEAVEVVDPQASSALHADRPLETVTELGCRPDVVRQDEDVLRGEVGVVVEHVADAFYDDGRLARAGAGEDHERPLAPFDRGPLLGGEPVAAGVSRSDVSHGHQSSHGGVTSRLSLTSASNWTPPDGRAPESRVGEAHFEQPGSCLRYGSGRGAAGPRSGDRHQAPIEVPPARRRAAKWDRAYGGVGRCVATDHHGGLDGDVTDAFSPHQWGR